MIEFRNEAFRKFGKSRYKRILVCITFVWIIWMAADYMHGEIENVWWHNFVCIALGILTELCIPWGKDKKVDLALRQASDFIDEVKTINKNLSYTVEEQNQIILKLKAKLENPSNKTTN